MTPDPTPPPTEPREMTDEQLTHALLTRLKDDEHLPYCDDWEFVAETCRRLRARSEPPQYHVVKGSGFIMHSASKEIVCAAGDKAEEICAKLNTAPSGVRK